METAHPLTLTVEQAGKALGVGRSTAYELVRTGDLASIRLRRRIVVPVAQLAELLGVDCDSVRHMLEWSASSLPSSGTTRSGDSMASGGGVSTTDALTLF